MSSISSHGVDGSSSDLVQLTYVSTRAPRVSDDEVVDLALRANRRNRELDITGCLWFGAGRFFQVLEGPRDAVDRLYSAIARDERHFDVHLLSLRPADGRVFSRWGLAHVPHSVDETIATEVRRYAGVTWQASMDPPQRDPSALGTLIDRLLSILGRREPETATN